MSNALDHGDQLFMAVSALAECLVGPARRSQRAIELVRTAIDRLPVSVVDLDTEIATRAPIRRARHRTLKLPDAVVIATATVSGADQLTMTDRTWPTADAMELTVVIEQIRAADRLSATSRTGRPGGAGHAARPTHVHNHRNPPPVRERHVRERHVRERSGARDRAAAWLSG